MKSNNYLFAETSGNFSSKPQPCRFCQTLQNGVVASIQINNFHPAIFPNFDKFFAPARIFCQRHIMYKSL